MDLRTAFARLERSDLENLSRQRTSYRYLGDQLALTRVLDAFPIYVDTRDRKVVPHLIMDGFWEMWVTQALARRVQPGWRCVDFGSSAGYYPVLLAQLGASEVLAYDRNRNSVGLIDRSFEVNGINASVNSYPTMELTDQDYGQFDFVKISENEIETLVSVVSPCASRAQMLLEIREVSPAIGSMLEWLRNKYVIEELDRDSNFKPLNLVDVKGTFWVWLTPM